MPTESLRYFVASSNLRAEYGGGAIQNYGDTAELTKETLCLRYLSQQMDIPKNYTSTIAEIVQSGDGTSQYIKMSDKLYTAILSHLTAGEIATATTTLPAGHTPVSKFSQFQPRGFGVTIIGIGDSITAGLGIPDADLKQNYLSQGINLISGETLVSITTPQTSDRERISKNFKLINLALGGSSFANTVDNSEDTHLYPLNLSLAYNQRIKTLPLNGGDGNIVISIWLGTNDLNYDPSLTGADVWARVVTRINAIKSDFPNAKIIFCTMIKRTRSSGYHAEISAFNTLVRANYASIGINAIADFEALVPQYNVTTGDVDNATYYLFNGETTDAVHPTLAGHTLFAPVWKDALLSIL